ncbi:MAG: peptidoglycan D,D-transpeptidase FtsI family protein [Candidatus Levyibacteriota bacterium]
MAERYTKIRLLLTLSLFILLYVLVLARLFYWQVVRTDDLTAIGRQQSSDRLTIQAKRGEILSSDSFPLATNQISYLLYANPKVVTNIDEYSKLLAPILETDSASLSAQLEKNLFWVRLAQTLPDSKKQEIEKLNLPGLGFQEESQRYYPEASMAAHLIGFLGKDKNGLNHGFFGLEGYYNAQMSGRDGSLYVIKDALGHPVINDIREEKKIDGRSMVLSLDRTMQYLVEKRLKDGVDAYGADGGSTIVMDTKTGEILAEASVPNFDPQHYYDFDPSSFKNPAISDLYEPGSTFKVLVMSAALDLGKVTPTTICTACSGPVPIGIYNISTWDNKYFPNETMTQVIQHSDNTGMVFVGKKLGQDNLLSYLAKFGIGQATGVDLQGEVSGPLRDVWREIDLATATFGQGISVTSMQLITAVNVIADGGNLLQPHVVKEIITEDGKKIEIPTQVEHRVIKESTSKVMTWIMVNAVENGEAKWTKLPNYSIAGKTGTAQIPVAGHYDPNQTVASFVGFFPAENPRITMLVVINKPKTSIYGAETAAPIFFATAKDIINYLGIPPSY